MPTPVLYLLVGPNGAGKSTFYDELLGPTTHLPFINADLIARERWPDDPMGHAYDAAREAADLRASAIEQRRSFIAETVFSHPSKLDLLTAAREAGYLTHLRVILIPEPLAVRRVGVRVELGGHDVPEDKIRGRFHRLWRLVRRAIDRASEAQILDNSRAQTPFRLVARYSAGRQVGPAEWPEWTPVDLLPDARRSGKR